MASDWQAGLSAPDRKRQRNHTVDRSSPQPSSTRRGGLRRSSARSILRRRQQFSVSVNLVSTLICLNGNSFGFSPGYAIELVA
jgi:hypothetical protein